jgi:hypothetical protein
VGGRGQQEQQKQQHEKRGRLAWWLGLTGARDRGRFVECVPAIGHSSMSPHFRLPGRCEKDARSKQVPKWPTPVLAHVSKLIN